MARLAVGGACLSVGIPPRLRDEAATETYYVASKRRDRACAMWRRAATRARQYVALPAVRRKCGIPGGGKRWAIRRAVVTSHSKSDRGCSTIVEWLYWAITSGAERTTMLGGVERGVHHRVP